MAVEKRVHGDIPYYYVGDWSFEVEDGNLDEIDETIRTWQEWREYVRTHPEEF